VGGLNLSVTLGIIAAKPILVMEDEDKNVT
jgi:hypothetical protein